MLKYGLIRYFLASCSLTRLVLQEKLTSGKKPKREQESELTETRTCIVALVR